MRKVALFASLSLLTACATPSSPPPVEQPRPVVVDPRVCADLVAEPRLPAGATIPQPVGAEEQRASEAFLGWVQAVLDWGRQSAGRAKTAKDAACR